MDVTLSFCSDASCSVTEARATCATLSQDAPHSLRTPASIQDQTKHSSLRLKIHDKYAWVVFQIHSDWRNEVCNLMRRIYAKCGAIALSPGSWRST